MSRSAAGGATSGFGAICFSFVCHVGVKANGLESQNLFDDVNLRSWCAFVFSATCVLNGSRLDLIPILYFDRGYNLEYNIVRLFINHIFFAYYSAFVGHNSSYFPNSS